MSCEWMSSYHHIQYHDSTGCTVHIHGYIPTIHMHIPYVSSVDVEREEKFTESKEQDPPIRTTSHPSSASHMNRKPAV